MHKKTQILKKTKKKNQNHVPAANEQHTFWEKRKAKLVIRKALNNRDRNKRRREETLEYKFVKLKTVSLAQVSRTFWYRNFDSVERLEKFWGSRADANEFYEF